jgi:hypothetical protein
VARVNRGDIAKESGEIKGGSDKWQVANREQRVEKWRSYPSESERS